MIATLEKRILLFTLLTLTLSIGILTAFNIVSFRNDFRDSIILRCRTLAEGMKLPIEGLLAHGILLTKLEGVEDRCRAMVANDPDIAYCAIEDRRGVLLYANEPRYSFNRGSELISAIDAHSARIAFSVGGEQFYDTSLNLYRPRGELVGRVRIGFPDAVLDSRIGGILQRSLLVLVVAFLTIFSLIFLFTKRDLIRPINRLREMARQIAGGNFDLPAPGLSTRELTELAVSMQEMAGSLKQRDVAIQEGYRNLEEANLELQKSYENLEKIGAELGRSREMYRSLLEDASDAIIVSDDQDQIEMVNKVAEQLFGVSKDKVCGQNLFNFFSHLQVEAVDLIYDLHQSVLKGESRETEFRFQRPDDGGSAIGWLRASSVTGTDGARHVQGIIRDVTREREIKTNLQESAKELARLNQMKDSFLGVASHELKTPLTVVLGYTELLLTEWADRLDPELYSMIQHISKSSDRLSAIVRDMVDVSMLEYRRLRLQKKPVDINQIITTVARELELFVRQRNLSLVRDLGDLRPCDADEERIGQVVSNLVGNAIKFTPDGGVIRVRSRMVDSFRTIQVPTPEPVTDLSLLGEERQSYIELVVEDSGIGIDSVDQPHVFEKFYEVGNIEEHFTAKTAFRGKGTGLGLAIVKGIVSMHGGEVWVESHGNDLEACPGSQFHVMLPLQASGEAVLSLK